MSWCGYIDILGSRELARRSPHELGVALDSFHSALADNFPTFEEASCVAFSDGAFFRTNAFANFYPFYSRVRNQLFQAGTFFRCSYMQGEIPIIDRETEDGRYLGAIVPAFRSFTFGGKAPEAYQRESEFKGVGCTIDQAPSDSALGLTVKSFYLRDDQPTAYVDFKYSEYELSAPDEETNNMEYSGQQRLFDSIIYNCHVSLSQSDKVGSYYLPSIVSAVRSSDFSMIDVGDDDRWIDSPYVFNKIFSGNGILKAIKEMPGLNYVLLAAFDHLYSQSSMSISPRVEKRVIAKMMTRPGCFRNLDRVPSFVISPAAKRRLIELRAEYQNISPRKA